MPAVPPYSSITTATSNNNLSNNIGFAQRVQQFAGIDLFKYFQINNTWKEAALLNQTVLEMKFIRGDDLTKCKLDIFAPGADLVKKAEEKAAKRAFKILRISH